MDSPQYDCRSYRRFGAEVELNTSDGSATRPDTGNGEIPLGSDLVAQAVHKATEDQVEIQSWDYIHNNESWVIKHDTSCGMEINSPVLKGWRGLRKLMKSVEYVEKSGIGADDRCSLHVHVNISDMSEEQLTKMIIYYIKCEHVLFDAFPSSRKNNRYCQCVGMTDLFSHDFPVEQTHDIISKVSQTKYCSINAYHFMKGGGFGDRNSRRKSIEIRLAENEGCVDPFFVKNWIRYLLHFFDMSKTFPKPYDYREGDPWSGLLWLDTEDVIKLLKFDNEDQLSEGMKQVRSWFIGRLKKYVLHGELPGVWSNTGRQKSWSVIEDLHLEESYEDRQEMLYGKRYII